MIVWIPQISTTMPSHFYCVNRFSKRPSLLVLIAPPIAPIAPDILHGFSSGFIVHSLWIQQSGHNWALKQPLMISFNMPWYQSGPSQLYSFFPKKRQTQSEFSPCFIIWLWDSWELGLAMAGGSHQHIKQGRSSKTLHSCSESRCDLSSVSDWGSSIADHNPCSGLLLVHFGSMSKLTVGLQNLETEDGEKGLGVTIAHGSQKTEGGEEMLIVFLNQRLKLKQVMQNDVQCCPTELNYSKIFVTGQGRRYWFWLKLNYHNKSSNSVLQMIPINYIKWTNPTGRFWTWQDTLHGRGGLNVRQKCAPDPILKSFFLTRPAWSLPKKVGAKSKLDKTFNLHWIQNESTLN